MDGGSGLKFSVVSHGAENDVPRRVTQNFDYQFARIEKIYRRIRLIRDSITDMYVGPLPTKL